MTRGQDTDGDSPVAGQGAGDGVPAPADRGPEDGGPGAGGGGPAAGDRAAESGSPAAGDRGAQSGSPAAGDPGAGARRARLVAADELPGDPVCLLPRVCPACGSVAGHDPPVTCPGCGREITAT